MDFAHRIAHLKAEGGYAVLARAQALEGQGREIIHLETGWPDAGSLPPLHQLLQEHRGSPAADGPCLGSALISPWFLWTQESEDNEDRQLNRLPIAPTRRSL